jgi:hypothetical protein
MTGRKRFLALLLLVVLLAGGLRAFMLQDQARKLLLREPPQGVGIGDSLQLLVEGLERELGGRSTYVVPHGPDPFDLRKAAHLLIPGTGKEKTEGGDMRLSMTLISPDKAVAIVKFKGLSHTLALGDSLEGWVLRGVDKKTITMEHLGKIQVLVNQPAPKAERQIEGQAGAPRLEELKL